MRTPIYLRRGNKADLPTLNVGEPGFASDTGELFVGRATGNERIHAPYDKTSAVRAYQTASQAISAGVNTKLLFDTEDYDHLGEFAASRFTASQAGIYSLCVGLLWPNTLASGNQTILMVYVNAVKVFELDDKVSTGTGYLKNNGSIHLKLAAGDYVEIYCQIAVATSTVNGQANTFLMMTRIA